MRFFASKTHYSLAAFMRLKEPFRSPGHWLHITQRGNDRQRVLSDADRQYFLDLLAVGSQERAVRVAAYNLMSNHFHSVAIGDQADTTSVLMMVTSASHPRWLDTEQFQRLRAPLADSRRLARQP